MVHQTIDRLDHIGHAAHRLELFGLDLLPVSFAGAPPDRWHLCCRAQILVKLGVQGHGVFIHLEQLDQGRLHLGKNVVSIHHDISSMADQAWTGPGQPGLDTGEMATGVRIVGGEHYAVTPLDGQSQLQRIDGIQTQSVTKQGSLVVDVIRGQPSRLRLSMMSCFISRCRFCIALP